MLIRVTIELDDGSKWSKVHGELYLDPCEAVGELSNGSGLVSVTFEQDATALTDWIEL